MSMPNKSAQGLFLVILVGVVGTAAYLLTRPAAPLPRDGEQAKQAPLAPAPVEPKDPLAMGQESFTNNCAACHGDKGDGNGIAARFLYPRPRNFGEAKYRLVSTANSLPTDDDLLAVITLGMPGSAMFSFGHLPEAERKALVGYVRQLTKNAMLERAKLDEGPGANVAELGKQIDEVLTPGTFLALPGDLPAANADSVARGSKLYRDAGCVSCHGATGVGDGAQEQRDTSGMPIRPRDFTRGVFKGGREQAQLYRRILLGMPGSPMPASPQLKPSDAGDMINFILSLSNPAAGSKVEHRRQQIVARRSATPLGAPIADAAWQQAAPTAMVVTPLWWRSYEEPDMTVQALHDGQALAVRLVWNDRTVNDKPLRTEDFEDMASAQLFEGSREPFLGMGTSAGKVDLWMWRASWQHPIVESNSILDEYPFDMPIYRELTKGKEKDNPDFLTARAAGNLNTNASRAMSGSNLTAGGFGSLTFRPKASQVVTTQASWKDGKWTVVLRRPLAVGAEDGLGLAAGKPYSIAFAVWDGQARDRNGQKLVSIWHDLKLE